MLLQAVWYLLRISQVLKLPRVSSGIYDTSWLMDTNIIMPSIIVTVKPLVSWVSCWSRWASHCMPLHKAGLGYIKSVISHGAEHEHFLVFSLILDGVYSGVQLIGKLWFAIGDSTDALLRQECENTQDCIISEYIRRCWMSAAATCASVST